MKTKKPLKGDHKLAVYVSMIEGGKKNLSIAQIKEVIKILRNLDKIK